MSASMQSSKNKVAIYALAGIATSPDFMEGLCIELVRRYERDSRSAQATLLFPYGDWHVHTNKQLREITLDLLKSEGRRKQSIGGRRAAEAILASYRGGQLVLIGHSGGGLAAVHAAQLLMAEYGLSGIRIIQIGSPRCAIPVRLRDSVAYIVSVNAHGKWTDPVTRIGSWGAWDNKFGLRLWNQRLAAPPIAKVQIVGGHADYFRSREPYLLHQISNLERTVDAFWLWLIDPKRKEELK